MKRQSHPQEDLLRRFLRGEANGAERQAVVRHLLTGCQECLAVTRQVWRFADEPMVKPGRLRSVTSGGDAPKRAMQRARTSADPRPAQ